MKGVKQMATKSFLKTISINNNNTAQSFITALEGAKKNSKGKNIEYSRNCKEITGDKIKEFFDF